MKRPTTKKIPRRVGRPRGFDTDKVLDQALTVFWRKGYEGASMSDLTRATGINRPSMYAAFGDKESLFRKVLDRYTLGPASYVRRALAQKTAREVVERLLNDGADLLTSRDNPQGCLIVIGALACSSENEQVRRELVRRRKQTFQALCDRLTRAKAEGDLPKKSNPTDLARFTMTILRGMTVQAADGASRSELRRMIRLALEAWPE